MLAIFLAGTAALCAETPKVDLKPFEVQVERKPSSQNAFVQLVLWLWNKRPWYDAPTCDVESAAIPMADVSCLEQRRVQLNQKSNSTKGDQELFYRAMIFIRDQNGKPELADTAKKWREAYESNPTALPTWGDQKYLYRYLTHLATTQTGGPSWVPSRELTSPEAYLAKLAPGLEEYRKSNQAAAVSVFAADSKIEKSQSFRIGRGLTVHSLNSNNEPLGLLFENRGAGLRFLFDPNQLTPDAIASSRLGGAKPVLDFPGPMHGDEPRFIELAIVDGRIVNSLMGGGTRRSGLVVVTADGRAYPFHVQDIKPAVWGSKSTASALDLSRSQSDLIAFLNIARNEKLSVFMEMLMAETQGEGAEEKQSLTAFSNFAKARGTRLMVWKSQNDPRPSLLALPRVLTKNHAVWVAYRLGYRWAINLDVDYRDKAKYAGAEGPVEFGTDTRSELPFSRLVLFDEPVAR